MSELKDALIQELKDKVYAQQQVLESLVRARQLGLIPKTSPLLDECLEIGLARGWRRAHKHVDSPSPEAVQEAQHQEILNELYERFHVDPGVDND